MFHFHRRHRALSRSRKLIFVSFFFAIAFAIVEGVTSLYLNSFGLSESFIGYLSGSLTILSLIVAFSLTPFLERFRLTSMFIFSICVAIIGYTLLGFFYSLYFFIFIMILISTSGVIRITCLDILFRDNTSNRSLNQNGGLFYALLNLGWVVGMVISSILLLYIQVQSVFFFTGLFYLIGLTLFIMIHLKNIHKVRKKFDNNPLHNILRYFRNRKLLLPYAMVMGIMSWWSLVYVFVPLFMIRNRLSEPLIGVFFALATIPLIAFEYQVGKISSRKGFRFFFVWGFIGLALVSLALFFVNNIFIQLAILIGGSIFAAFLEPIQDTFFYKQVGRSDEEVFYPIYGTATHIGAFVGKFSIATVLLTLPDNYAYLASAGIMGLFAAIAGLVPKDQK